jgi:hypothetical protein
MFIMIGFISGTGSSCIYPLLGCRLNQWKFLASEIDDQNMYFASKNIAGNKMEDQITSMWNNCFVWSNFDGPHRNSATFPSLIDNLKYIFEHIC